MARVRRKCDHCYIIGSCQVDYLNCLVTLMTVKQEQDFLCWQRLYVFDKMFHVLDKYFISHPSLWGWITNRSRWTALHQSIIHILTSKEKHGWDMHPTCTHCANDCRSHSFLCADSFSNLFQSTLRNNFPRFLHCCYARLVHIEYSMCTIIFFLKLLPEQLIKFVYLHTVETSHAGHTCCLG